MRRLTCSLEVSILMLLMGVVVVLALFGLLSQVDAQGKTYGVTKFYRTVDAMVFDSFGQMVSAPVTRASVQNLVIQQWPYTRAAIECPNTAYLPIQGYKMTFTYQGVWFDYRADAKLTTLVLCHVKVR